METILTADIDEQLADKTTKTKHKIYTPIVHYLLTSLIYTKHCHKMSFFIPDRYV